MIALILAFVVGVILGGTAATVIVSVLVVGAIADETVRGEAR